MAAVAGALAGPPAWATERSREPAAQRPRVLEERPATPNDLAAARGQNSAQLAADPTDSRFVVLANRLDAPDFGCALQISGDGGRGWVPANPVPKVPRPAEKCYAPEVAFDRDGVLYYLFAGLAGPGNTPTGVYLTTSENRARSFSKPRPLLGSGNFQARMAIDPTMGDQGRLYIMWLKTTGDPPLGGLPPPPNPIMLSFSDDGGDTFSEPVQVNDPDRELSVAPALAIGRDHAVHVVYYDLQDDRRDYQGLEGPTWPGKWSLVSTTSVDGGRRFRRGVVVDDGIVPPERVILIYTMPPPTLAVGPSGHVFAGWYDARNRDWDVFLRRSSDGGRSWEGPVRVNDDRLGNGRDQYLPRLSVAPNGRVDAIFLDRRDDPKNDYNRTYYAFSTDGGKRFAPNLRLASANSDSRNGGRYAVPSAKGLVDYGSRLGLLSRDQSVLAAWTDARHSLGSAQEYFKSPAQDVLTTQVIFPGSEAATSGALRQDRSPPSADADDGGTGGWIPSLVGAVALAGAAAGILLGRRRRARRAGERPA